MPTLEWIGKDKVVNHHLDVPYRVLERQYSYDESGKHTADNGSENMIIHGDNLDALKSLLPQYEGRVKCIYIDPPYNTGNEGWVYNDNVNDPRIKAWLGKVVGAEGEDLSRHDKWLCMMYPRLKLLQRLLSDDGVIFISIDDTEQFYLKLVCDEIFSKSNYVCSFIWQKRYSPPPDTKEVGYMHETILMYRKSELFQMQLLPFTEEQLSRYQNPDNDPRGPWKAMDYTCRFTTAQRPNLNYPITNPNTGEVIMPNANRAWAMSLETHQKNVAENRVYWGIDGRNHVPALKNFLCDIKQGRMPNTLLLYTEVGHNQEAKQQIKVIFPEGNLFDTPKPVRLIEHFLKISTKNDDIILDSFAGSGTTAHAVLKMNKADGGNRKFILVEMMNYADSITAERVKRVINGYGEGRQAVAGTGGNFSYYELGEPLMNGDVLNENVGVDKIRQYVYFTDTKSRLPETHPDEPYFMGVHVNSAYYFYYERQAITTLNREFLHTVKTRADAYVIYADLCTLSEAELEKYHITFKKIPRDITRL